MMIRLTKEAADKVVSDILDINREVELRGMTDYEIRIVTPPVNLNAPGPITEAYAQICLMTETA